jgi:hypothetical protein
METYDGQGFPLSPIQCRQGRDRMGGGGGGKCTMRDGVVCGGFGTRRPSNLEAFCEKASRGTLSVLLSVYEVNIFYD